MNSTLQGSLSSGQQGSLLAVLLLVTQPGLRDGTEVTFTCDLKTVN